MASQPASMEAGRIMDAMGLLPDYIIEPADAIQAYVQTKLASKVKTWARLPREQWPKSWDGMRDPVCPLEYALYGHPEAGAYWEKHNHDCLLKAG